MEDDEHAIAQRDECDSMAAIFSDDFTLASQNPISYSIRLRPDFSPDAERNAKMTNPPSSLWPVPEHLALTVTYPPTYPDVAPTFGLLVEEDDDDGSEEKRRDRPSPLHAIQERALLNAVAIAAEAESGMPSAYGCVRAACEFLENGGLAQAGLSLLSDDCLAHVLSFLASSRVAVEEACAALPIFEAASRTNVVWRELCRRRWGEKWGFRERWNVALDRFQADSDQHFWMKTYDDEEEDAKRSIVTRRELSAMTFDYRQWFSFTLFRNQPVNMRDVLPTGLRHPIARDVVFSADGTMCSVRDWMRRLAWKSNKPIDGAMAEVRLCFESNGRSSVGESLTVHRLKNWGWELRGSDYVMRAIDAGLSSEEQLWGDLTSKIVLEEKPDWVEAHRSPYPYQYREIPDDDDYKLLLDW